MKKNYYIELLENAKDVIRDFEDLENVPYVTTKEIDEVIAYIKRLELYKEFYLLRVDYENTTDSEERCKLLDMLVEIEEKIVEGL